VTELQKLTGILDQLDLPKDEYMVGGSGIMVLNDIDRKLGDLDIFCTTALWFDLYEYRGLLLHIPPSDTYKRFDPPYLYQTLNGIEVNIFSAWRLRSDEVAKGHVVDLEKIWASREFRHGYPTATLEFLRGWKSFVGREKDREDIRLIDTHLHPQDDRTGLGRAVTRMFQPPAEEVCYCGKTKSRCIEDNGSGCHHPFAAAHMWGD
jgi:hypothetical protein